MNQKKMRRWTTAALGAAALGVATLGVTPSDADAQQPRVRTGENPDYHVIRDGDTIWDLSGFYYGDSFEWPRLWSYNPHITNPHWIYPGDILYLRAMAGETTAGDGVAQQQRGLTQDDSATEQPMGLYLPLGGMITTEELESVGRIIGSPKAAHMLVEHDTVWVDFGENAYREDERESLDDDEIMAMQDTDVSVGDRFAIVRLEGPLEDADGEHRGDKYIVLGSLVITEISERENVAKTALIDQSWREIERGDILVPYERQLKLVQPRQAEQDLVAHIVDSLDPGFAFGPQQYVFIDRGAEDGVRVGNRFFIFQRFEGLDRFGSDAPPEIPWQRVGQVLVLDVREQHSIAVITRSNREVIIGDRLEMYAGH